MMQHVRTIQLGKINDHTSKSSAFQSARRLLFFFSVTAFFPLFCFPFLRWGKQNKNKTVLLRESNATNIQKKSHVFPLFLYRYRLCPQRQQRWHRNLKKKLWQTVSRSINRSQSVERKKKQEKKHLEGNKKAANAIALRRTHPLSFLTAKHYRLLALLISSTIYRSTK